MNDWLKQSDKYVQQNTTLLLKITKNLAFTDNETGTKGVFIYYTK